MQPHHAAACLLSLTTAPALAQIVLDGTLGPAGPLAGPDYVIGAELGQRFGGQLFHSFRDFSLNSGESATFTGPNGIGSVIARVTGGNPSLLDGTLRSTVPDADFYFINPAGVLFGADARLDLPGAVFISTADRLSLQDGGSFDAHRPEDSVLSAAPVAAFGFLGDTPAPLGIQGSQLMLAPEQNLSLLGGDLLIIDAHIEVPGGRLNLASAASPGQISIPPLDVLVEATPGTVDIHNARLSVSGDGGGGVFLVGGQVTLSASRLEAITSADVDGKGINVRVGELVLADGSLISTTTRNTGDGGNITLIVNGALRASGYDADGAGNAIFSEARGDTPDSGASGFIVIVAGSMQFSDGTLSTTSFGPAASGDITLNITGPLQLTGGTSITSTATGPGHGGDITISTGGTLALSGSNGNNQGSNILAESRGELATAGDAGDIVISAADITLDDGAIISSSTRGPGSGGDITLQIGDELLLGGRDGDDKGSAVFAESLGMDPGAGDAGDIHVTAHTITLLDNTTIRSAANTSGGGNITLTLPDSGLLFLLHSELTSSVRSGVGSGGNITVMNPQFIVLNDARIVARADTGNGGDITLTADMFLTTPDTVIDASSRQSLAGTVQVSAPETDLTIELTELNTVFDAATLLRPDCAARFDAQAGSFIVTPAAGLPPTPEELGVIAPPAAAHPPTLAQLDFDCGGVMP